MHQISWGIIGCGDVTEVKSGPAFNKVSNSSLHAVMRRDIKKAADYAARHKVPAYYNSATHLINDPLVNAIYIATPPHMHEAYALQAIAAGKPVYLEKPMALDHASAVRINEAAKSADVKLSVAHYRREQPVFRKIKELITAGAIGTPYLAELKYFRCAPTSMQMMKPGMQWRLDPATSGGGLFHDLAPHQVDLLIYLFGTETSMINGCSRNIAGVYKTDDLVTGVIGFSSGVSFTGIWNFSALDEDVTDELTLYGKEGKITVQVFQHKSFALHRYGRVETFRFDEIPHVQLPMIEKVVQYFLDKGNNPCPGEEAVKCMEIMDKFTTQKVI